MLKAIVGGIIGLAAGWWAHSVYGKPVADGGGGKDEADTPPAIENDPKKYKWAVFGTDAMDDPAKWKVGDEKTLKAFFYDGDPMKIAELFSSEGMANTATIKGRLIGFAKYTNLKGEPASGAVFSVMSVQSKDKEGRAPYPGEQVLGP